MAAPAKRTIDSPVFENIDLFQNTGGRPHPVAELPMHRALLLLVFSIVLAPAAFAQAESKCDIIAFVTDPASGVNVRSGPGKDFSIVKTVPKDPGRTIFRVSASKGGWLKVTLAENSRAPADKVFSGTGWVFAPVLSLTELRDYYKVFEGPSRNSKRIDISLHDHILPLAGCKGGWVKVELPVTGTGVAEKKRTGWLPAGTWCGNPAYECESD
jgi:hypothetical protein